MFYVSVNEAKKNIEHKLFSLSIVIARQLCMFKLQYSLTKSFGVCQYHLTRNLIKKRYMAFDIYTESLLTTNMTSRISILEHFCEFLVLPYCVNFLDVSLLATHVLCTWLTMAAVTPKWHVARDEWQETSGK